MEKGEVILVDGVRIYDSVGNEVVIWTLDEIKESPQDVVTAIVNAVILVEQEKVDTLKKLINWRG